MKFVDIKIGQSTAERFGRPDTLCTLDDIPIVSKKAPKDVTAGLEKLCSGLVLLWSVHTNDWELYLQEQGKLVHQFSLKGEQPGMWVVEKAKRCEGNNTECRKLGPEELKKKFRILAQEALLEQEIEKNKPMIEILQDMKKWADLCLVKHRTTSSGPLGRGRLDDAKPKRFKVIDVGL